MTCACNITLVLLITVFVAAGPVHACTPPERPFLPASRDDMRAYADLIRKDFEAYIADVQVYFRCLDEERARTFVEIREVRVKSLDELNAWLLDKCVAYAKAHRHPEEADKTIWEMFEAERPHLVPYVGRFDGFHSVPASVSKTCTVQRL